MSKEIVSPTAGKASEHLHGHNSFSPLFNPIENLSSYDVPSIAIVTSVFTSRDIPEDMVTIRLRGGEEGDLSG